MLPSVSAAPRVVPPPRGDFLLFQHGNEAGIPQIQQNSGRSRESLQILGKSKPNFKRGEGKSRGVSAMQGGLMAFSALRAVHSGTR